MTVQAADNLVNEHPRVKLEGLYLYGVIRGDIHARSGWGEQYQFVSPPSPPNAMSCSALWRGYLATFRLDQSGELELVKYDYMLSLAKWQTQEVHELLTGDFWLVMKPEFFGQRTYVPFRQRRIVEDRDAWFTEEPFAFRHGEWPIKTIPSENWPAMLAFYRQLIEDYGWRQQQPMLDFVAWLAASEHSRALYPSSWYESLGISRAATREERSHAPMVYIKYSHIKRRFTIHYQRSQGDEVKAEIVESANDQEVFAQILHWLGTSSATERLG